MTKNMKRIHKVTVRRIEDDSPDTSWLGKYSDTPSGEFAIDRHHDKDCPKFWADADVDEEFECDCDDRTERGSYQYFNPGSVEPFKTDATWIPATVTGEKAREEYWRNAMRKNAIANYDRIEQLHNDYFSFIGITAEAEINLMASIGVYANSGKPVYTIQHITSGGLWGIESDSDAAYLKEIEDEQLSELRDQLHAIGFSQRAITAAFRNVERG